MKIAPLGSQGLFVSRMGLGCMGMSDFYHDDAQESECIKTIQYSLDRGINFFDTADMYGPFKNEVLLGKALKDRRDSAIIATKFGLVRNEKGDFLGIDGSPKYVKQACEASLKRLGVECIDLYYQHRVDTKVPIEETVGAMKELVVEGKVKYLGLSEASSESIKRAHKIHPITALQTEYSLWSRDIESNSILDTIRDLGIGLVAYSPLGRGFLTGKIKCIDDLAENDYRRHSPRFEGENLKENLELEGKVEELAHAINVTPAQIALAWIMSQGSDIIPIPGTKRIARLQENINSIYLDLTQEEIRLLEKTFAPLMVKGDRYEDMSGLNL